MNPWQRSLFLGTVRGVTFTLSIGFNPFPRSMLTINDVRFSAANATPSSLYQHDFELGFWLAVWVGLSVGLAVLARGVWGGSI